MGRMRLSPPNDRHVAELALLSVVSAEGRHTMLSEGAYLDRRGSSHDDHWAFNGFTAPSRRRDFG